MKTVTFRRPTKRALEGIRGCGRTPMKTVAGSPADKTGSGRGARALGLGSGGGVVERAVWSEGPSVGTSHGR